LRQKHPLAASAMAASSGNIAGFSQITRFTAIEANDSARGCHPTFRRGA
jgi:hypothetical protein